MINRVYSMLLKGVQPSSAYYSRRCTSAAYRADPSWRWFGDMLIPASSGAGYSQYCSDQLVQIIRKSLLKGQLASFDPLNSYVYEFDTIVPVTSKDGLPAGLYCDLLEPVSMKTWVEADPVITVNISGDTVSVDGTVQSLGWDSAGRQSAVIPVKDGLSIRIRGTPASCTFHLHLVRPPARDINALVSAMRNGAVPWHADYAQYKDSTDQDTWLAAAVLSYCRKLE